MWKAVVLERLIGTGIRRVESPILASCGQKNGPKVDPLRSGQALQGLSCTATLCAHSVVARQTRQIAKELKLTRTMQRHQAFREHSPE